MFRKILLWSIILCTISCSKETLKKQYDRIITASGPEDIVLDVKNDRLIVSCDERRDDKPDIGVLYQISLTSDESKELKMINLPSIPFHPHGIDFQTVNGTDYLFVINHYGDALQTNGIEQFKINEDNLEFIREYKNPLLISPNDITVLPNGSFYFSNDKNSTDVLELLLNPNKGSVGFCNGGDVWKIVDSLISFPNGMYNEHNILYLATSRNHALFTYTILPDGSLNDKKVLSNINGMDNITNHGDELIIAVHPDEIKFALLSYIPTIFSPSKSYSINKSTGETKVIFSDDGRMLSGGSTSLIYNNTLYLSQVFDGFVLKIENYNVEE
ncbi:MAG: hypothetical protein IPM95_01020 [Sphingobacteriales bacterium]|nr:hypothetical protein [Sphingobacteriales bacterium]